LVEGVALLAEDMASGEGWEGYGGDSGENEKGGGLRNLQDRTTGNEENVNDVFIHSLVCAYEWMYAL
jgi:hypothetical protein